MFVECRAGILVAVEPPASANIEATIGEATLAPPIGHQYSGVASLMVSFLATNSSWGSGES